MKWCVQPNWRFQKKKPAKKLSNWISVISFRFFFSFFWFVLVFVMFLCLFSLCESKDFVGNIILVLLNKSALWLVHCWSIHKHNAMLSNPLRTEKQQQNSNTRKKRRKRKNTEKQTKTKKCKFKEEQKQIQSPQTKRNKKTPKTKNNNSTMQNNQTKQNSSQSSLFARGLFLDQKWDEVLLLCLQIWWLESLFQRNWNWFLIALSVILFWRLTRSVWHSLNCISLLCFFVCFWVFWRRKSERKKRKWKGSCVFCWVFASMCLVLVRKWKCVLIDWLSCFVLDHIFLAILFTFQKSFFFLIFVKVDPRPKTHSNQSFLKNFWVENQVLLQLNMRLPVHGTSFSFFDFSFAVCLITFVNCWYSGLLDSKISKPTITILYSALFQFEKQSLNWSIFLCIFRSNHNCDLSTELFDNWNQELWVIRLVFFVFLPRASNEPTQHFGENNNKKHQFFAIANKTVQMWGYSCVKTKANTVSPNNECSKNTLFSFFFAHWMTFGFSSVLLCWVKAFLEQKYPHRWIWKCWTTQ